MEGAKQTDQEVATWQADGLACRIWMDMGYGAASVMSTVLANAIDMFDTI